MKLHFYADTDSLHIELKSSLGPEPRKIAEGLNVDFDESDAAVGLDIDPPLPRCLVVDDRREPRIAAVRFQTFQFGLNSV